MSTNGDRTAAEIIEECTKLGDMLLEKNRKYGDSALSPIRVFSKASVTEQILVRIDDKLSRIRTAALGEDEDVVQDLLGYLILLRISRRRNPAKVDGHEGYLGRGPDDREGRGNPEDRAVEGGGGHHPKTEPSPPPDSVGSAPGLLVGDEDAIGSPNAVPSPFVQSSIVTEYSDDRLLRRVPR